VRATWFVLVAYAVWFGLSLLTQSYMPRFKRQVRRVDLFRVFFSWTLFMSSPQHTALAWRDQLRDHTFCAWQAVSLVPQSTWLAPLWHPQLCHPHLLHILVVSMVNVVQATPRPGIRAIETGFAYRALWHYIAHLPRTPETAARQFKIMVSDDVAQSPRVVYISALHPLPSTDPGEPPRRRVKHSLQGGTRCSFSPIRTVASWQ
jgi:hypothetical protein